MFTNFCCDAKAQIVQNNKKNFFELGQRKTYFYYYFKALYFCRNYKLFIRSESRKAMSSSFSGKKPTSMFNKNPQK